MQSPTHRLFDIPFSARTQKDTLQAILDLARKPQGSSVLFCNAHVVVESEWSKELKALLNRATVVVPDGTPIAWVLNAKGRSEAQKYPGPDFMEDLLKADPQGRHFFLGSSLEVLEKIKSKFKGHLVGTYSPPFTRQFSDDELGRQLKLVEDSGADYIWIGLGAPKQERHAVEMASRASKGVWLAVGAAFDFYAGVKPRAPKFLQKIGMEWAFRAVTEPRRLGRRYLQTNPLFIKLAVKELLSGSKSL